MCIVAIVRVAPNGNPMVDMPICRMLNETGMVLSLELLNIAHQGKIEINVGHKIKREHIVPYVTAVYADVKACWSAFPPSVEGVRHRVATGGLPGRFT